MNDELIKEVFDLDTFVEIWSALYNSFTVNSSTKIFQHKSELSKLKKENMSIMKYIATIKETVRQLASAGYNVNEEDQVHAILN